MSIKSNIRPAARKKHPRRSQPPAQKRQIPGAHTHNPGHSYFATGGLKLLGASSLAVGFACLLVRHSGTPPLSLALGGDTVLKLVLIWCGLSIVYFGLGSALSRYSKSMSQSCNRGLRLTCVAGFPLLYIAILAFFRVVDVYHRYFFEVNPKVYICYNMARTVFCGYIVLMAFYLGRLLLKLLRRRGSELSLTPLEYFLTCFWTGAVVLNTGFFLLGYLNTYYYAFAVGLTVIVVGFSGRAVGDLLSTFTAAAVRRHSETDIVEKLLTAMFLGIISIEFFIVLTGQGLFPLAEHDYNTHYFPYLLQVIENHGFWPPTDVWYHNFYSKGNGMTFLCMLLTDPLAIQLVHLSFLSMASLTLFALLKRVSVQSFLPFAAVVMFQAVFIEQQFWAVLFKDHIMNLCLISASFWMLVLLPEKNDSRDNTWLILTILILAGQVVFDSVSFSIMCGFCFGYSLLLLIAGEKQSCSRVLVCGAGCLGAYLVVLALNYFTMGMAENTPWRLWWSLADQARFSRWFSPYLVIIHEEGSAGNHGGIDLPKFKMLLDYSLWQRLMKFNSARFLLPSWKWSLSLCGTALFLYFTNYIRSTGDTLLGFFAHFIKICRFYWKKAIMFLCRQKSSQIKLSSYGRDGEQLPNLNGPFIIGKPSCFSCYLMILTLGVLAVAAILYLFGAGQPISANRYYVFCVFYVVLGATLLWMAVELLCPGGSLRYAAFGLAALAVSGYAVIVALSNASTPSAPARFVSTNPDMVGKIALGKMSLAQGFQKWDALWPPAVEIRNIIGPKTRVRAFHINRYCMAPEAYLESDISFGLKGEWHNIILGPADLAAELLKKQNLNYFLIDTEFPFFDLFIYSDLFQPQNISRFFCIAWHSGSVYLLTWRDQPTCRTEILTTDFIERFQRNIDYSEKVSHNLRELYGRMKYIYEKNDRRRYPVFRDLSLPPVKGWQ